MAPADTVSYTGIPARHLTALGGPHRKIGAVCLRKIV
ncbi:hypothetical protein BN2475_650011 [Paraburkholderia ribeironis]|uniref:Uncharacterized protein n=1 Tax=Paraburkholderia ribeironis TaxID=1247936 RepID=A0A1N7SGE6_9BURK|nr:hypothetical protein BN2475_650011 [Paraburkholderia ribeironis]